MSDAAKVTCECGECVLKLADWPTWETQSGEYLCCCGDPQSWAFCPRCGARLSFDADGNPVARRMVPEDETLEEMIARRDETPADWSKIIGQWPGDETDEEVAQALAGLDGPPMVPRSALEWLASVAAEAEDREAFAYGDMEPRTSATLILEALAAAEEARDGEES